MDWDLTYGGGASHSPAAGSPVSHEVTQGKALVTAPNVQFDGLVRVNGTDYVINAWQGSENHNWGANTRTSTRGGK